METNYLRNFLKWSRIADQYSVNLFHGGKGNTLCYWKQLKVILHTVYQEKGRIFLAGVKGQRTDKPKPLLTLFCGSTTYILTEFRCLSTSESMLKDFIFLTIDVTFLYQLFSLTFQLLLLFVVYLALY